MTEVEKPRITPISRETADRLRRECPKCESQDLAKKMLDDSIWEEIRCNKCNAVWHSAEPMKKARSIREMVK